MIRGCEIDTGDLSPDEAASIRQMVKQSGMLKASKEPNPEARDLIGYEITIETAEGVFQSAFDDLSVPEGAAALLKYLSGKAEPRPPR